MIYKRNVQRYVFRDYIIPCHHIEWYKKILLIPEIDLKSIT